MKKNDISIVRHDSNAIRTYHRIVAGFPGVGKSTAASLYPYKFIDMESSYYHWIYDENNGTKECAPNWPNNYVNAIISAATTATYPTSQKQIICISTHKEVLAELTARGIAFDAVCPNSKDIYIQRYIDRGNNEAFVELLRAKFESFVQDVVNSNAGIVYYTDGYFSDLFYNNNDSYRNGTVMHNLNSKAFPMKYTDKIIVAIWPVGMASEIDNGNTIDTINHPLTQFGVAYPFIHHAKIEIIKETFTNDISETDEKYLNDCYYGYAKALASTDKYPEVAFIAVDAYPDIVDKLNAEEMNYILLVPASYKKYSQYCSTPMSEQDFEIVRRNLMDSCFHTIISDQFVPLCFDAASKNISHTSFIESLKNNNTEV